MSISSSENTQFNLPTFNAFHKYITTYQVAVESQDNQFLQRLKILASASNQFVQFRLVKDSQYQIFTECELPSNINQTIGEYSLTELVPFRSMVVDFSDGVKLLNYSIYRVKSLTNDDFLKKMRENQTFKTYPSYEGSVLVAHHNGVEWTLRTTSRSSANDSSFGAQHSYTELFNEVCINKGFANWTSALDELKKQYDNHYFVFVLVSDEHKYICLYPQFKSEAFLINVRSTTTNIDVDFNQAVFTVSNSVDVDFVQQSLQDNKKFDNKLLNLQGYVLKDPLTGQLYKTLTGAYFFASSQIPNYPNKFLRFLHCFFKGSFPLFTTLYDVPKDESLIMFNQSKNTLNGIRNMVAYIFTLFTDFNLKSVEDGVDEHNKPKFKMEKSYERRNSEFYAKLFDAKDSSVNDALQVYKRTLAATQKYSLKSKGFTDSSQLAQDIEKYLRTLAYNEKTFTLFIDLLLNYEKFKNHLVAKTLEYNDSVSILRKQSGPLSKKHQNPQDAQKFRFVNLFNNNNENVLLTVCKTYFTHVNTVLVQTATAEDSAVNKDSNNAVFHSP